MQDRRIRMLCGSFFYNNLHRRADGYIFVKKSIACYNVDELNDESLKSISKRGLDPKWKKGEKVDELMDKYNIDTNYHFDD